MARCALTSMSDQCFDLRGGDQDRMPRMMCQTCMKNWVKAPHRLYCSVKCMQSRGRTERMHERNLKRCKILSEGFDFPARKLFEEAGLFLQAEDPRAWFYRLILDLVAGHASRSPIRLDNPDLRNAKSIVFPEPNRRSHLDTRGVRRPGDFYTLREDFEWPSVPLAAWYRVQLLGVCDGGEPLVLEPLRKDQGVLRVQLPASPYGDSWRYPAWGRLRVPRRKTEAFSTSEDELKKKI